MIITELLRDYLESSNRKVINITGKIFYIFKKEKNYFDDLKVDLYDFEKKIILEFINILILNWETFGLLNIYIIKKLEL